MANRVGAVFATAVIVASLFIPAVVSRSFGATPSKETIKIGFLSSLSGPFAMLTRYSSPAVQMVFDKVNASGGMFGKQIQIITRDDQGDPSVVAQKLSELKGEGCIAIVGPFLGANGRPAIQWAAANNIPLITCSSPSISDRVHYNKYTFFTVPVQDATSEAMLRGMLSKPVKSFYFLGADIVNAHEMYDYMADKLKKTHPEIVNLGSVWPSFTNQEFSNIISAALAKKPDVIIIGQAGPGWAALCQQGMKFNLFKKARTVGCYMLESAVTASFGKNYPVGMETVGWCPFWEQSKPMQDYLKEHLALTKVYPADKGIELHLAALGLVAAMKKAGSTDPEAIAGALENLAFDGPIGPVHFDDYDHQLKIPIWYETTGYSKDFPIAVATHMIKYGDEVYPTKEEMLALRKVK